MRCVSFNVRITCVGIVEAIRLFARHIPVKHRKQRLSSKVTFIIHHWLFFLKATFDLLVNFGSNSSKSLFEMRAKKALIYGRRHFMGHEMERKSHTPKKIIKISMEAKLIPQ